MTSRLLRQPTRVRTSVVWLALLLVPASSWAGGAKAVAVGRFHSCALTDVGGVKCFTTSWSRGWGLDAQGDTPVPGDFDGDGQADLCVYRPSNGAWFVLTSLSGYTGWTYFGWGTVGDIPSPADFGGDGVTDAAVYRPGEGRWYVRPSSGDTQWTVVFGQSGDVPLSGRQ